MKRASFAFTSINIRRAPGFADAGFKVEALSPGVNIVYGPNASGKTTLARAIRRLLWPQADGASAEEVRATSLVGELTCDERRHVIEFDAAHVRHQCDGAAGDPLLVAPLESHDRYLLALHELLSDRNGTFAEQIARESAGGYDIRGASEALCFKGQTPRAGSATTQVRELRRQLRHARDAQQQLQQRHETLGELERRRDEATAAVDFRELIAHAQRYATARARLDLARRRLAEFPEQLARLKGDERERLAAFRDRSTRLSQQERDAQRDYEAAQARLAECRLGESGLSAGILTRLRHLADDLDQDEAELARFNLEWSRARTVRDDARKWLGRETSDESLAELDLPALDELFALAKRLEEHRARSATAAAERARLAPAGEPADPELLREALDHLNRWLAAAQGAANGATPLRWLATAAGAVLVATSLVAAAVHHLAWGALVLLGAIFLALAWLLSRDERNSRDEAQSAYERLGLSVPPAWLPSEVRMHTSELARRWARANLEAERAQRRCQVDAELAELEREQQSLAAGRAQLATRLRLTTDNDVATCVWADHLLRWQRANAEVGSLAQARAELDARRRDRLGLLAAELAPLGYTVTDRSSAAGAIEDLAERHDRFQRESGETSQARSRVATSEQALALLEEERARWLAGLGLNRSDETMLDDLIQQYEAFVSARDELRRSEGELELADAALADAPGLRDRSPQELAAELARSSDAAEEARQLSEEIGKIRQAVETAKQQADVEGLLAREEQACDALRELRASAARAVVGDLLADHLSRQSRERDRPVVFRRARELFARITHGRYQLELDDGEPPSFRAIDTSTALGHALDELSSGTRLQLLLAVRVAFVESQEQGPKLPLLLDETLGNSDERRASEIIDAALEICRDGRQLFYFTAQHDEVRKWREVLAARADVPHAVIDLAACRGFSEAERLGRLDPVPPMTLDIPAADGHDHATYGRELGVAAFDVRRPIGAAHVWYVCDDAQAVYELLRLGINNWGQLSTLCRTTGTPPVIDGFDFARAAAAARALDRISEMRRVGLRREVDRRALLESNAVTKQFLDDVAALCQQHAGDARTIVEALENKAVKNFRTAACGLLREFFVREGYLDDRVPFTRDEIRLDALGVVMDELNQGRITAERLDQLLALTDPPAGTETPNGQQNGDRRASKSGRVAVDTAIGDSLF